jgi:hypothetical protein
MHDHNGEGHAAGGGANDMPRVLAREKKDKVPVAAG